MPTKSVRFIVSQTYDVITPESAEHGETAESGFDFEGQAYTAQDLHEYLESKGFMHASSSVLTGKNDWITAPPVQDRAWFESGTERTISLHLKCVMGVEGHTLDGEVADSLWVRMLSKHLAQVHTQGYAASEESFRI